MSKQDRVYDSYKAKLFAQAMKLAGVDEIHIVSTLLHAHLAGRKLNLRHIR